MITDFLDTNTSKPDLATALTVLKEFKDCESNGEYIATPFIAWAKLEQLEEFLEHLVNGADLAPDTIEYRSKL